MKRLFLLRHAEASMNAPTDRERPLTENGLAQATTLGAEMKRQGFVPDFIYCSPARRTRQTFEKLSFENVPSEQPDRLYNAPAGDILSFIQNTSDDIANLLVVAHNPGIHQIAAMLAEDDNSAESSKLRMGYSPATLTVLSCACEKWSDIKMGANPIIEIIES